MPNTFMAAACPAQAPGTVSPHWGHIDPSVAQPTASWQTNQQFIGMLNAYRPSGGLARAQEVAAKCQSSMGTSTHTLAHWMVKRKVICFEWQSRMWLPLFQFNQRDMTLQEGLGDVLAELVVVLDDWAIANWFTRINPWLADATPADAWAASASEVLNAARSECYVVAG